MERYETKMERKKNGTEWVRRENTHLMVHFLNATNVKEEKYSGSPIWVTGMYLFESSPLHSRLYIKMTL